MIPQIDQYAYMDSPFHRWDPRIKLIAFMILIFTFSLVDTLNLLPVMLTLTMIIFYFSNLPFKYLVSRLKLPGFFIIMLAVILPLFYGKIVLVQLGFLSIKQEGSLHLILVMVKFISILTLGIILFGTTPFQINVKAMRSLGLPLLLTDMVLFSYRYLFEFAAMFRGMQTAIRLRGFQEGKIKSIKTYAHLAGTMLVRSYEQSDRVYKAMILRGYGNPTESMNKHEEFSAYHKNYILLSIFMILAVLFIATPIFM